MSRIHPEDPRVTAHALGELSGAEAAAVEGAMLTNPAVSEALNETRQLAICLEAVFGAQDLTLDPARREEIRKAGRVPAPEQIVSMRPSRRWGWAVGVTAAAAALVVGAVWVMVITPVGEGEMSHARESALRREAQLQVLLAPESPPAKLLPGRSAPAASRSGARTPGGDPSAPDPSADRSGALPARGTAALTIGAEERRELRRLFEEDPEAFLKHAEEAARTAELAELRQLPPLIENPYQSSREAPRTTVPLVAGGASFRIVERYVRGEGILPPKNAVRIEELVNHVHYEGDGDDGAADLDGVRLGTELVRCPWDEESLLLGILLRNDSDRPLPENANLELDFKPDMVRSYRLLGYARQDEGVGAVEPMPRTLRPGKSNYVFYELLPAKQAIFNEHWVMLRAGLVLAAPGENSGPVLLSPVTSPPRDWDGASSNFQTASVLAACGLLLCDSPYRGALDPSALRLLAERALRSAPDGDSARRGALQLVLDTVPLLPAAGE